MTRDQEESLQHYLAEKKYTEGIGGWFIDTFVKNAVYGQTIIRKFAKDGHIEMEVRGKKIKKPFSMKALQKVKVVLNPKYAEDSEDIIKKIVVVGPTTLEKMHDHYRVNCLLSRANKKPDPESLESFYNTIIENDLKSVEEEQLTADLKAEFDLIADEAKNEKKKADELKKEKEESKKKPKSKIDEEKTE